MTHYYIVSIANCVKKIVVSFECPKTQYIECIWDIQIKQPCVKITCLFLQCKPKRSNFRVGDKSSTLIFSLVLVFFV